MTKKIYELCFLDDAKTKLVKVDLPSDPERYNETTGQ